MSKLVSDLLGKVPKMDYIEFILGYGPQIATTLFVFKSWICCIYHLLCLLSFMYDSNFNKMLEVSNSTIGILWLTGMGLEIMFNFRGKKANMRQSNRFQKMGRKFRSPNSQFAVFSVGLWVFHYTLFSAEGSSVAWLIKFIIVQRICCIHHFNENIILQRDFYE